MAFPKKNTNTETKTEESMEDMQARMAEMQAKLDAAKSDASAAAEATEEEVVKEVEAEVVKPKKAKAAPKKTSAVAKKSNNAIALPTAFGGMVVTALDETLALDASTFGFDFPTVKQVEGRLQEENGQDDIECYDELPTGAKPPRMIFLGYRLNVTAWKTGYDDRKDSKEKPVYSNTISGNDPLFPQIMGLCKDYQFSGSKADFDFDTSKVGHIFPQLEVLMYNADCDQPVVVRTNSRYVSVQNTLRHIDEHLTQMNDDNEKVLTSAPCTTSFGKKDNVSKKGIAWTDHWLNFDVSVDDKAKKVAASFNDFIGELDDEMNEKVATWMGATDKEATKIKASIENYV